MGSEDGEGYNRYLRILLGTSMMLLNHSAETMDSWHLKVIGLLEGDG